MGRKSQPIHVNPVVCILFPQTYRKSLFWQMTCYVLMQFKTSAPTSDCLCPWKDWPQTNNSLKYLQVVWEEKKKKEKYISVMLPQPDSFLSLEKEIRYWSAYSRIQISQVCCLWQSSLQTLSVPQPLHLESALKFFVEAVEIIKLFIFLHSGY